MMKDDQHIFEPIRNPYIVGKPVKDKAMFFGREEDLAFVRQKVMGGEEGGLLVLCGARRSGKTSILHQILNGRLGDDYISILVDMQSMAVESDADFWSKLGLRILDGLKSANVSLEEELLAGFQIDTGSAVIAFVERTAEYLGGRKLLLLFDEYELLEVRITEQSLTTDVLDLFGHLIDNVNNVFFVFTGSKQIEDRNPDYWSRFLSKAVFSKRISFLSQTDTIRLIQEPLRGTVEYEGGVPERIYQLTAGHVFYTQMFCQALVDHLNEVRSYTITSEHLQGVVDQLVDNPHPDMTFSWSSLSDVEKLAVSIISELARQEVKTVGRKDIVHYTKKEKIGFAFDSSILEESLEELFHKDWLDKERKGDRYQIKMGLWRHWIARMHSIWRVVDEIKGDGGEPGAGIRIATGGRSRIGWLVAASGVVVVLAAGAFYLSTKGPPNPATSVADSTWVTVRTVPSGADVRLGRSYLGSSPLERVRVPADTVELIVTKRGYKDFTDTVALASDEPMEFPTIALARRFGGLRIVTDPIGAAVFVDDKMHHARTPCTIDSLWIEDRYTIELNLAGYGSISIPGVTIEEDSILSIERQFSALSQQVWIRTVPEDAQVAVGGVDIDHRARPWKFLYGEHRITVERVGYKTEERVVKIPTEESPISIPLTRLPPGFLVVSIMGFGDVYIDGDLKKEATRHYASLPLSVGSCLVQVKRDGFETFERMVTIESADTTRLTVELEQSNGSANQ